MTVGKPLNDVYIKNLKSDTPKKKHYDTGGLFLFISPSGTKLWRMAYRFNGKEKLLSFGPYPLISLKEARDKRDEARKLLLDNIDPSEHKKAKIAAINAKTENTFEIVAREWFARNESSWAKSNSSKVIARLQNDIFPFIGSIGVAELTAPDILKALRHIESRGAIDTAHRALQNCGQVLRYAIATGRATQDVSSYLRGALLPVKKRHYPTITEPQKVGELLRALDSYHGNVIVSCAIRIMPYVFVRPSELRNAEWAEFNFEKKEWRIPGNRMKMGIQHIVPLPPQVLALLEHLRQFSGYGRLLFPGMRTTDRAISDNTMNAALRRLGYGSDEMVMHGFRAMASTLLNEQGYNRDWVERQLAHGERDSIRAAYNYAEFLPDRRKMMLAWANYLDELKNGNTEGKHYTDE